MCVGYSAIRVEEIVEVVLDDVVGEISDDEGGSVRGPGERHLDRIFKMPLIL